VSEISLYRVGGCVRDALLGRRSKDIDYAVEAPSYDAMVAWVRDRGTVWQERPQFQTVRAKVAGIDADFVLCRRDGAYSDARRPDSVELGDIYDDLARRDFTMNAIAVCEADKIPIDPHGGRADIGARLIRTVGAAEDRFNEDALRLLRAMRFHLTLGFDLHGDIRGCLTDAALLDKLVAVSVERQQLELEKCFRADTLRTLEFFEEFSGLRARIFSTSRIWLDPTMKERANA
jgi:tRNA nucleotidyltransferase (CCA-adding enzyme)